MSPSFGRQWIVPFIQRQPHVCRPNVFRPNVVVNLVLAWWLISARKRSKDLTNGGGWVARFFWIIKFAIISDMTQTVVGWY